jgi:hypothetical protein
MKKEDLLKKLEKIETPDITLKTHKEKLKKAMIEKFFQKKKFFFVLNDLKKATTALGILILLFVSVLLLSNLPFQKDEVLAKEIALKNKEVQDLIKKGGKIEDIKIIKNKAYVLVSPPLKIQEDLSGKGLKLIKEPTKGILAEIELKEKKVSGIEKIIPSIYPLSREEREKAKNIITETEREIIKPGILKIKEVNPLPSFPYKLRKKDKTIEVLQRKRVEVLYKIGRSQWKGNVDLNEEKLEKKEFQGRDLK